MNKDRKQLTFPVLYRDIETRLRAPGVVATEQNKWDTKQCQRQVEQDRKWGW